jgi:hypothetical protein
MIGKPISVAGGVLIAVAMFIAGAIIDAMITVWVMRKWGVKCPYADSIKNEEKACEPSN